MDKVYTIGTDSRRLKDFVAVLRHYRIKRLVDVRAFPTSSRFPHFKRENLERSMKRYGIEYIYLGNLLGGFRKGGYQRYTKTEKFKEGLRALESYAQERPTAFMCAELIFFRCHRRFIADKLARRGWSVIHIVDKEKYF